MRRARGLVLYAVAATAIVLALPLGSGSAATMASSDGAGGFRPAGVAPYRLTVNVDGGGSVGVQYGETTTSCSDSCEYLIYENQTVTLTANASSGWVFANWSGDISPCGSTENPCSFTMGTADRSITAHFGVVQRQLTVNIDPAGAGRVTDDLGGIDCPNDCAQSYDNGTVVTLTATDNPGYRFKEWTGSCTGTQRTCSVTMSQKRAVTAHFVRVHTLTVSVATAGGHVTGPGIDCPGDCTEQYDEGQFVSITATEDAGYDFAGWGGDCAPSGTQTTCRLLMDADRTATASFAPEAGATTYTLSVSVSGSGTVTGPGISCPGDCSEQIVAGTQVALTATEAPGSSFGGWGADCAPAGTAKTCNLAMTSDKSASATFTSIVVTGKNHLTVVRNGGGGKVTGPGIDCPSQCEADYQAGSTVTLSASESGGWNFRGWGNACQGFGPCTVVMDGNKTVFANFSTDPVIRDEPEANLFSAATDPAGQGHAIEVSLDGANGGAVVGGATSAFRLAAANAKAPPISCSSDSYACYAEYSSGQSVTLTAKARTGFVFIGWTGACSGKQPTCVVKTTRVRAVRASFAPRNKQTAKLSMQVAAFRVQWRASLGRGRVIVTGRIAAPARLTLELRRPKGGPLLKLPLRVRRAGAFRIPQSLPSPRFRRGAKLLPGGFVLSVRGKAGGAYVPMQLRTLQARGPTEGVVRRSFASATRQGRTISRFPAGVKAAWANFTFAQQPKRGLTLAAYWYWPPGGRNAKVLGFVRKANRPVVSTWIRDSGGIPRGRWRVDLYAGGKLVKSQYVFVGTS